MDLIVAFSSNWAIGKDNDLLFSLKTDMKYFRQNTLEKTVILGRKNLDSFPGGRPLPKRENLVLTHDPAFAREGAVICRSKAEIMDKIADQDPDRVMVIGGAEIYRLFLKDCRSAFVTRIDAAVEDADCFFPNLEEDPDWICTSVSEPMTENGLTFRFCIYENSACSA